MLVYFVAVILVGSVLGTGIVSLTTTSTFTQLESLPSEQARYLAQSGLEYALKNERERGTYQSQDGNYFVADRDPSSSGRTIIVDSHVQEDSLLQSSSFSITGLGAIYIDPYAEWSEEQINDFIEDNNDVRIPNFAKANWDALQDPVATNMQEEEVNVLGSNKSGSLLFTPIPVTNKCRQYVIRSIVRHSSSNSGGYGIFFDTELTADHEPDSGYSFQFDAQNKKISIISWDEGEEQSTVAEQSIDKSEEWWNDFHYVESRVTGWGSGRKATINIYDLKAGEDYSVKGISDFQDSGPWNLQDKVSLSYNYSFDLNFDLEEQIYTGFEVLENDPTYFHYLEIERICDPPPVQGLVLLAQDDISLLGSSKAEGDVQSNNGDVDLTDDGKITGDLTVHSGATIYNASGVQGEIIYDDEGKDFCSFSAPYAPSGQDEFVSTDDTIQLSDSNTYNQIKIENDAELTVEVDNDRVIVLNELNLEQGHIKIDGSGRLIIYVLNSFDMNGDSTINSNGDAENMIVYYSGANQIDMGSNTSYHGALYATDPSVNLSGSASLTGYVESNSFDGAYDIRLISEYYNSFTDYCTFAADNIGFDETGDDNLDQYWEQIGNTDAEYSNAGPTSGGAVRFKGEAGVLGLDWYENEEIELDLQQIRDENDGLLDYDIQVKLKARLTGQKGKFYMMGLNSRLVTNNSGMVSGYGLSFFRYTPDQKQKDIPNWVDHLGPGFDTAGIKDGTPWLILWKTESGSDEIELIDYAELDSIAGFLDNQGELHDWSTMVLSMKEEHDQDSQNNTYNEITAYIQNPESTPPVAMPKGERIWNYSEYIRVDWENNGQDAIIDDSLDSSGVENGENEIGVHSFYDSGDQNEQFQADFGLAI